MRDRRSPHRPTAAAQSERGVVTALVVLLLTLWLGFAVHRSPRFPGSLTGTALAVSGAALIVLPALVYSAFARIPTLTRRLGARLPRRRLLAWHVYGGIVGSLLALLHTGHRFDSVLGMALTGAMLLAVLSGYIGRHFLGQVSLELREKQALLDELVTAYNHIAATLAAFPRHLTAVAAAPRRWARLRPPFAVSGQAPHDESLALAHRATRLAESIADLEYAIKTHALLKRRFAVWLAVHIAASLAFYALLALHIWAAIHFGLRWLA